MLNSYDIQNSKLGLLLPPQLKNNGDFAGNAYIDVDSWGKLTIIMAPGTTDAAIGSTAEGTAPLVEECDTTDGTYTAVSGAALADAIAATEDDSLFAIEIDLQRSHKRYMRVQAPHSANGTTGANLCIIGILTKPSGLAPNTAAGRGLVEQIIA